MLTMIGAINEFETTNLIEKQQEGIVETKKKEKYKGGQKKRVLTFDVFYFKYLNRVISKSTLERGLRISRPMLNRLI
jgi:DNA invertase Pin-like site-specific DNA recombinase